MKKAIILTLLLGGTLNAISQGTINFSGSSAFPITISTGGAPTKIGAQNAASVAAGAGGGQVTVELFVGSSTSSLMLAGITTNGTSTVNAAQGAFTSQTSYVLGSGPGTSTTTFSSAAYATGAVIDFQYYAYTANGLYTAYSQIETDYVLGGGVSAPAATFGNGAGQVNGLEFSVPEPSVIALGGLGTIGLLLFRRRR